jgi:hypothetical protein
MALELDESRTKYIVQMALKAVGKSEGFFINGLFRPENKFVELVKNLGEQEGNTGFAANALFLTTTLVFGDDTGKLFNRISDAQRLNEYKWIFDPSEATPENKFLLMAGCANFFKPAGYNRRAVLEWPYNLELLGRRYKGNIRNFFDQFGGDAERIVGALTVRPRAKTEEKRKKDMFTRFGPKLAALVVQWIKQYGLYEFNSSSNGRVPVDFQVARVLIQTGALKLTQPENAHQVTTTIGNGLKTISDQEGWSAADVSEALWNIGYLGCNTKKHENCPIQDECMTLISRKPNDKDGKYDPKDVGRWIE